MMPVFAYTARPEILNWLAAGQLLNRLSRSVRLWVILRRLYHPDLPWVAELPPSFGYGHLRDRLFSATHPRGEIVRSEAIHNLCHDPLCLCHQSLRQLIFTSDLIMSESEWIDAIRRYSGLASRDLEVGLAGYPFATVHRSLRDDLKFLVQQGWLRSPQRGQYQGISAAAAPVLSREAGIDEPMLSLEGFTMAQMWELLRILESVAFVQPQLDVLVKMLWDRIMQSTSPKTRWGEQPQRRLFMHLDYILSDVVQERVDIYQNQIEELWRYPTAGVVQFDYWLAQDERQVSVTVYPVCLHYVRRAKYLSAYGLDPTDQIQWHNYRLDRVSSPRLTVLPWGDPSIPSELRERWRTGTLPTADEVETALAEAWGFNFYLPRSLLILRFSAQFARWYVDQTERHPTFQRISYTQLLKQVPRKIVDLREQEQILNLLAERSPQDAYYWGWIRVPDINVMMRLRDWRPNGEVIAPLAIRSRMQEEVWQECINYAVVKQPDASGNR